VFLGPPVQCAIANQLEYVFGIGHYLLIIPPLHVPVCSTSSLSSAGPSYQAVPRSFISPHSLIFVRFGYALSYFGCLPSRHFSATGGTRPGFCRGLEQSCAWRQIQRGGHCYRQMADARKGRFAFFRALYRRRQRLRGHGMARSQRERGVLFSVPVRMSSTSQIERKCL